MFFTFTVVAWVRYLVGKPSHMLSRAAKIPKKKKKRERISGKPHKNPPCMHANCFSLVQLFSTLWTVALQTPLSMGFSMQGYWSGLPFPPPGDLPHPGSNPHWQVGSLPLAPPLGHDNWGGEVSNFSLCTTGMFCHKHVIL